MCGDGATQMSKLKFEKFVQGHIDSYTLEPRANPGHLAQVLALNWKADNYSPKYRKEISSLKNQENWLMISIK